MSWKGFLGLGPSLRIEKQIMEALKVQVKIPLENFHVEVMRFWLLGSDFPYHCEAEKWP